MNAVRMYCDQCSRPLGMFDVDNKCDECREGRKDMNLWTEKEIELLNSKMTDREIAEKTNRSLKAVRMKRYRMKKESEIMPKETPGDLMDDTTKEIRILTLCKKLGVKLFGR